MATTATLPEGGAPPAADEDLYSDEGSPAEEAAETKEEEAGEASDSMETTLPRSILPNDGYKVGDYFRMKITGLHDDEIVAKCAPDKEGSKPEEKAEMADEGEMTPGDTEYD